MAGEGRTIQTTRLAAPAIRILPQAEEAGTRRPGARAKTRRTADDMATDARKLASLIEHLPEIVNGLSARAGKPKYVEDGKDSRFLYDSPNWCVYTVLKAVRLVSGLRSCMILLQYGHTVEASVLLRTVGDFVGDILFAQEAIKSGTNTAEQERELTQFFEDFKDHPERQYAGVFKVRRPERRKVRAAQARHLNPENTDAVNRLLSAVDHRMSGYVHGSYSTIMEMYEGHRDEFDMQGMIGSHRVSECLAAVSLYFDMATAALIFIAIELRDQERVGQLERLQQENSVG